MVPLPLEQGSVIEVGANDRISTGSRCRKLRARSGWGDPDILETGPVGLFLTASRIWERTKAVRLKGWGAEVAVTAVPEDDPELMDWLTVEATDWTTVPADPVTPPPVPVLPPPPQAERANRPAKIKGAAALPIRFAAFPESSDSFVPCSFRRSIDSSPCDGQFLCPTIVEGLIGFRPVRKINSIIFLFFQLFPSIS